ncbi:MAG: DNA-binding protein [Myxococcales bacterium]
MTKAELIDAVTSQTQLTRKTVEAIVNTIFDSMIDAMRDGERIEIRGFGNFTMKEYRAYNGRNPKTGDTVPVPSKRMPFFKVGKDLRDRVDNGE